MPAMPVPAIPMPYPQPFQNFAPDPVFVSDLEGKILQTNDAVSQLLGFRPDEVIEQSLSQFFCPDATRQLSPASIVFGVMRDTHDSRLNPRSESGDVIPATTT